MGPTRIYECIYVVDLTGLNNPALLGYIQALPLERNNGHIAIVINRQTLDAPIYRFAIRPDLLEERLLAELLWTFRLLPARTRTDPSVSFRFYLIPLSKSAGSLGNNPVDQTYPERLATIPPNPAGPATGRLTIPRPRPPSLDGAALDRPRVALDGGGTLPAS